LEGHFLEPEIDLDDYINSLTKEIESLKNIVESLKLEVRTQRKEIALLREERKAILDSDKPPGWCIKW
jgi:peptidoglycan hydrolase CwlO-like protein